MKRGANEIDSEYDMQQVYVSFFLPWCNKHVHNNLLMF